MTNRDKLLILDPLRLAVVRKSLRAIAECISDLDNADVARYLPTLIEELQMLKSGDSSSMAWGQVAKSLDGPRSYGLERVGLLPVDEKQ